MDLSVLGVASTDNDDGANSNNIIFTLKDTELYVSVVTLSKKKKKAIKNYQNSSAKELKDLYCGMNIKQKVKIKIQHMCIGIFLNQTLWKLTDCLF